MRLNEKTIHKDSRDFDFFDNRSCFFSFKKDINKEDLISDAFSVCRFGSDRAGSILCFRKILEKDVVKYGLRPFVEAVGNMFKNGYPDLASPTQCHDILHALGEIGGIYSESINRTVSECSEVCTYGCFHGVIEGYLMSGADIIKEMPKLCQIDDEDGGKLKSACYHGLGHSAASIAGFDLVKALNLCSLIPEERYKVDCGSGVIMELYELGSFDHALLQWPVDIPKFCGTLAYPYSEVCYTTSGLHEYGRSQDIQKAFRTCGSIPKNLFNQCNVSIGQNFYYVFQGSSPEIIEACQNKDETVFLNCVQGVLNAVFAVDPSSQKGLEICDRLDDKLKNKCLELLIK